MKAVQVGILMLVMEYRYRYLVPDLNILKVSKQYLQPQSPSEPVSQFSEELHQANILSYWCLEEKTEEEHGEY